jgi:alpha-L-fucosidase 2
MNQSTSQQDLADALRRLHTSYPASGFVSTAPAETWDDGTVVGNGIQGALAFCRTSTEEVVLSHEELFLPLFPDHGYLPVREHYDTVRQLVMEGNAGAAQELLLKLKKEGDFPDYNTTDPFVGACSLDLHMHHRDKNTSYIRSVNFETAESLTAWEDSGGLFHRRLFVSRADNVIVLRLSSPVGSRISVSLGLREIEREPAEHPLDRDLYAITIDGCEGSVSDTLLTHRMRFKKRWGSQPVNGCITLGRVIVQGGSAAADNGQLTVSDAEELLLLVRTVPDRRGEHLSVEDEVSALSDLEPTYGSLLQSHARIHGEIFGRSSLQLAEPAEQLCSSEEMQAASSVGNTNPALVEKAFAAARYGIISSTGRLPPALQGVWTGTWKPRWSGDYTLNGNVQSAVAASLCGNHFECLESLLKYLDTLLDDFRSNARELLGFRGFLIPWRSSTHGRTHYLAYRKYHHNFPGVYWFAGAAWFAQLYFDYYLYTADTGFLESRLKPFLLESAAFYEDYLTLEQDGVFVLSPSSSPENELEDDIWMAPNATMTIAAAKQLFRNLLFLKKELGISAAQVERWRMLIAKLPTYQVGANGAVKEWAWPGIENREVHRHASHLYPLYYGMAPEIAEDEDLREAFRVAIDKRMEFRRHEDGSAMAFGFTQLGMSAAHLGDTDLAYESVEYLVNSYWSPAMVSQHDPRFTMNLDISGGLPAVIITMLVQSLQPDRPDGPWLIRLLSALPDAWPTGKLRGVRCRGGFEADVSWRDGVLQTATITSLRGEPCRVEYGDRSVPLSLARDKSCSLTAGLEKQ